MTSVSDTRRRSAAPALGTFERYLTLWVALCILAGIVLGRLLPEPFQILGRMTVAEVNIPVAVLIWLMIVPMLLKVDFGALHRVAEQWRGIAVTVGINWLVKPFSMAFLGWLFIGWLFRPWLPAGQIDSYIAGLIILAAAPCTAMVFVWSNLTDGEPNFTLTQVALNDTIMVFAFAPIVGLLLGLSSITVPWTTLFLSVVLYIVVPVIAAQLWRRSLLARGGEGALAQTLRTLQPISLIALLGTLVLLFGFQGEQIVRQPLIIALLAVPIVIQVLSHCRRRLRAQPGPRGPAQCRLPVGSDRRLELLRARRRRRDRTVRISVGCGAGDRRWRAGRGSGDALRRAHRVAHPCLVRAPLFDIAPMRQIPAIRTRPATPADAAAIAEIYNQGVAERVATFETEPRTPAQIAAWLKPGNFVIVVAAEGPGPVAFAASFPYSPRPCYAGIGEFSVYVARDFRGRGVGKAALAALIEAARHGGLHKLTSRVFPEKRRVAPCSKGSVSRRSESTVATENWVASGATVSSSSGCLAIKIAELTGETRRRRRRARHGADSGLGVELLPSRHSCRSDRGRAGSVTHCRVWRLLGLAAGVRLSRPAGWPCDRRAWWPRRACAV
jgi:ACR3 family arsenite transporter